MKRKFIYIAFQCDQWLSDENKKMVYIGEDIHDVIAQICASKDLGVTEEQAAQLKDNIKSDEFGEYGTCTVCSDNRNNEFMVERFWLNGFC